MRVACRHRAVNLFLQGYEKSWIETEEHYFEDKLIEDLAVSAFMGFFFVVVFLHSILLLGGLEMSLSVTELSCPSDLSLAQLVTQSTSTHCLFF